MWDMCVQEGAAGAELRVFFQVFPFLFVLAVGGLGFEFCVFVASWRHALRSEWTFIIIMLLMWAVGCGGPKGRH